MTGAHLPFKAAVEARDLQAVRACLADDIVFRSPVVHRPYEGIDATMMILAGVMQVFQEFGYVDVLDAGDRVGLVFRTEVGDRVVEGWDYLRFGEDGRVRELTVMLRPLSGITAVAERMKALLEAQPSA